MTPWLYQLPVKTASGKQCCQEDEELRKEATGNMQRVELLRNGLPRWLRRLGRLLR